MRLPSRLRNALPKLPLKILNFGFCWAMLRGSMDATRPPSTPTITGSHFNLTPFEALRDSRRLMPEWAAMLTPRNC